ncbi:SPOR domain-containing protein [Seohaeicola nanhaiensis]|uniref:SPOR domain-containing protein n=1 Tax=Seohaeicola nanhaiensis TaxID=1387282 RepID=A0ABV9KEA8_9RHOB
MGEARDFSVRTMRLAGLIVMTLGLAACEEGLTTGSTEGEAARAEAPANLGAAPKGGQRDMEAPEVFSADEAGLWDGRPSLGGVWVAHPDVTSPERVVIRNTANGKSVTGALFRRERDVPGPRFQASSEAAEALGMLAGAPVKLTVVALRRADAAPAVAAAAEAEPAKAGLDPVADVPVETAGAEKQPFFKRVFGRKPEATAAAAETGGAVEAAQPVNVSELPSASAPAVSESAPPPKKTPFKGLFRPKGSDEPVGAPLTALAPVETAPPAAAPAAPPPAKPKAKASALSQPFVQVGTFGEKANANRAADKLRKTGMVPTVKPETINGKTFWRVVVGPATSETERETLLTRLRDAGFNDAYAVTQ